MSWHQLRGPRGRRRERGRGRLGFSRSGRLTGWCSKAHMALLGEDASLDSSGLVWGQDPIDVPLPP